MNVVADEDCLIYGVNIYAAAASAATAVVSIDAELTVANLLTTSLQSGVVSILNSLNAAGHYLRLQPFLKYPVKNGQTVFVAANGACSVIVYFEPMVN